MGAAGGSLIGSWAISRAMAACVAAIVGASSLGCGSDVEELPETVAPPPDLGVAGGSSREDALYDESGDLLPSEERVAGLVLPRGLEALVSEGRRHVYTSDVPLARVQRYFGPRLVTGEVDARPGGGATYHAALPRDARGSEVRLDVTIEPSSARATRVEIVELEPPPVTPPSEAETIERARERLERAD